MFDAATYAPNGKHYFFAGNLYWRYDFDNKKVDPGYPLLLSTYWPDVPPAPDAAFIGPASDPARARKIYFLKGSLCWLYDFDNNQVEPGYPRQITDVFPQCWSADYEAAVTLGDEVWFFKLGNYIRFNLKTMRRVQDAQSINTLGAVPDRLDCAVSGVGERAHKLYFMSSNRMERYSRQTLLPPPETRVTVTRYNTQGSGHVEASYNLTQHWDGFDKRIPDSMEKKITAFEAKPGTGSFPNIARADVASGIRRAIADPNTVRQQDKGLCGPAAITYCLLRRAPEDYLEWMTTLYDTGGFDAHDHRVETSDSFRASSGNGTASAAGNTISSANWLFLGALKDDRNGPLRKIDGDEEGRKETWRMGSSAGAMRKWTKKILGFGDADINRTYVLGEKRALLQAHGAHCDAGVSFIMLDVDRLLNNDDSSRKPLAPDHWVVYEGALNLIDPKPVIRSDNRYRFDIWTWGRRVRIDADHDHFTAGFFGVVYSD